MADIIVGFIIAVIVAGVIFYMIKSKKNGKTCCGCSCGNCKNCK